MAKARDLTGRRFGGWVVLHRAGVNSAGSATWMCLCDCGSRRVVRGARLTNGSSLSCGCLKSQLNKEKSAHGGQATDGRGRVTPEYNSWQKMIQRCANPEDPSYPNYGGRGIRVCDRWQSSFVAFLSDMGRRPSARMTLERKDTNGNYEPDNCCWATRREQNINQRRSIYLTLGGERLHLTEWAERLGVQPKTLRARLRSGWCDERVLTTPVDKRCDWRRRSA